MNKKDHHLHKAIPSRLREVAVSPNTQQQKQRVNTKRKQNMFQMKEHDKISEKDLNEVAINNRPDKELKAMVIKCSPTREKKG